MLCGVFGGALEWDDIRIASPCAEVVAVVKDLARLWSNCLGSAVNRSHPGRYVGGFAGVVATVKVLDQILRSTNLFLTPLRSNHRRRSFLLRLQSVGVRFEPK